MPINIKTMGYFELLKLYNKIGWEITKRSLPFLIVFIIISLIVYYYSTKRR